MDQSPRLSLSYLMPAQAQKHVTVNETFRRLDQLVQQTVLSRTLAAEPGAPNDGDAYILPASPTGTAWGNYTVNNIAAFQDGAWTEIIASEGFSAWVGDADEFVIYDGAAWNEVSGGGETAAIFGVNTTADATNKFAVKSNAVLFDALDAGEGGAGDMQVKVNKEAAGDTASHLFQTGFSGRAEFGLTGDDDFHVKVSPNGSSWTDAIFIDKDNGNVGIGATTPNSKLQVDGVVRIAGSTTDSSSQLSFVAGGGRGSVLSGSEANIYLSDINTGSAPFDQIGNLIIEGRGDSAGRSISFLTGTSSAVAGYFLIGFVVGAPTGGDKGAGNINAQAVYDDNMLLTCYVFDQALDGAIDDQKWDGKVPDRIIPEEIETDEETGEQRIIKPKETIVRTHEPMRKFRARIGTADDPLTLDGYAKHWREKRHLTSMPNEAAFDPEQGLSSGEWVQRLVETVEIQAILIEELNQRVKAIEAAPAVRP